MKSVIGKSLALGLLVGAAAVAACSTHNPGPGTASVETPGSVIPSSEGTGTVGFQYTLPGGSILNTVTYTLTNGTNTYTKTIPVGDAGAISFVISGVGFTIGIPAGVCFLSPVAFGLDIAPESCCANSVMQKNPAITNQNSTRRMVLILPPVWLTSCCAQRPLDFRRLPSHHTISPTEAFGARPRWNGRGTASRA